MSVKKLLTTFFVFILILISPLSYSSLLSDKMSGSQSETTNKTLKTDGTEGKTTTKSEFQKSQLSSENISLVDKFMNLKTREKQIIIGTIIFCLVVCFGFTRYFLTGKQ